MSIKSKKKGAGKGNPSARQKKESGSLLSLEDLALKTLLNSLMERYRNDELSLEEVKFEILGMVSRLDRMLEDQLNAILHHPKFQALEASWRSLSFLVSSFKKFKNLQFKVLNVAQPELLRDFEKSMEAQYSHLHDLMYKREYGTFGGTPFSLLIGNYQFSHKARDLFLMDSVAQVMSEAHCVFVASVHPHLLDMESFRELGLSRNLSWIARRTELAKWRSFRKKGISRYVCLTAPRILLRVPYGEGQGRISLDSLNFEEQTYNNRENFLWGNAAYGLGQRICHSFVTHGWPVRFYGSQGGLVEHLTSVRYEELNKNQIKMDVLVTDAVERQLSELGILALCYSRHKEKPVVMGTQSVYEPRVFSGSSRGNENERLSSMLPHVLTASRFAHYLKTILRDKIGKFTDRKGLEKYLNNWLGQYSIADTSGDSDLRYKLPLRSSRVEIVESKNKPGKFFFI
ncbi:MAG: type VI secretion system contractile sheath large subunit, partial [Proteobacteria bacterium]|nr:type VI secretion system contractile sheath large subunit [Pseudomonadota bacterium]